MNSYKLDPTVMYGEKPKDVYKSITETNDFIESNCNECHSSWSWQKAGRSTEKLNALRHKLMHIGFTCYTCIGKGKRERKLKELDAQEQKEWGGGNACKD
jgi:hypothetical protein